MIHKLDLRSRIRCKDRDYLWNFQEKRQDFISFSPNPLLFEPFFEDFESLLVRNGVKNSLFQLIIKIFLYFCRCNPYGEHDILVMN